MNASADYAGFAEMWAPILRTRAHENGCFVVAVNRTGEEGGNRFFGNSLVIAPDGTVVESADADECVFAAEVDLGDVREYRNSMHMYRDYRPELYGPIVSFSGMHQD